ncbi:SMI1/KNR4 family protein [Chitinophaga silvatica]|uniref:SMI1/KNR4 family protein n=1 Tax=Chitinophaga silvatica TaxID=2282649 RepID=A0A3E1Y5T8_9BACT|nr:SMI1/KNR4 family protein [Chitinophaga silvatica]RFS20099.1 SMI1/KNR4 family protein [Chitinophaga silvatica]
MKNTIIEILQQWQNEKIKLNPPASHDLIAKVEIEIGFSFPEEFEELYKQTNGFTDFNWRENMFSIWPLERILDEYNSSNDKDFIGFSDFLINSHNIGFLKSQPGVFKKYVINEYTLVSESFIESIKLINSNSDLIY